MSLLEEPNPLPSGCRPAPRYVLVEHGVSAATDDKALTVARGQLPPNTAQMAGPMVNGAPRPNNS